MIKPGKVCSQPMKANNTGEININVVGKYFWLTFVFNGSKTSLNLCLRSSIALNLFLIFEIRGVLSLKKSLEGGNQVKQIMHAPWCITGCPSNNFHQGHMQRTSMGGGSKHCFVGNSWWHVKQGSMDMTQSKGIKWKDQQCKQRSGWESLGSATSGARRHESHKRRIITLEENRAKGGTRPPRPVGLPYKMHPRCSSSAGKQLSHLSVCVLEFLVQNHLRLSHPSQVSFAQQNHTLNPLKVHTPK
jgi:hypothetical protein